MSEARTFRVDALIIRVDADERLFIAAHRPIAGYMPAMTMSFRVRDGAELAELSPGTRVQFEIEGGFARGIRKLAVADPDLIRSGIAIGTVVPDFELTDQLGRIVRLSHLRGKVVALQFIYTRCPVAEVCPRMAASFAALQRRYDRSDLALLSVSLDPRYDTPSVLLGYAALWQAKPRSWRFLTGSADAVDRVAQSFGVVYWPEDGTLTHTARTALIGRDGRLAALIEGSEFRTDQLIKLVEHHLEITR
jgi:protein SCO1/2